jgi:hypothetical protein
MEIDRILKKIFGFFITGALKATEKRLVPKLKRNVHPEQRSGSQSLRSGLGIDKNRNFGFGIPHGSTQ